MTHKVIGDLYSFDEKKVTHILRILNLEPGIQDRIEKGLLSLGHIKVILSAPKEEQLSLSNKTIRWSWSVRDLEAQVKKLLSPPSSQKAPSKDKDVIRLEDMVSETVGLKTDVQYNNNKGNGTISFKFSSFEELQGLFDKLNIEIN